MSARLKAIQEKGGKRPTPNDEALAAELSSATQHRHAGDVRDKFDVTAMIDDTRLSPHAARHYAFTSQEAHERMKTLWAQQNDKGTQQCQAEPRTNGQQQCQAESETESEPRTYELWKYELKTRGRASRIEMETEWYDEHFDHSHEALERHKIQDVSQSLQDFIDNRLWMPRIKTGTAYEFASYVAFNSFTKLPCLWNVGISVLMSQELCLRFQRELDRIDTGFTDIAQTEHFRDNTGQLPNSIRSQIKNSCVLTVHNFFKGFSTKIEVYKGSLKQIISTDANLAEFECGQVKILLAQAVVHFNSTGWMKKDISPRVAVEKLYETKLHSFLNGTRKKIAAHGVWSLEFAKQLKQPMVDDDDKYTYDHGKHGDMLSGLYFPLARYLIKICPHIKAALEKCDGSKLFLLEDQRQQLFDNDDDLDGDGILKTMISAVNVNGGSVRR